VLETVESTKTKDTHVLTYNSRRGIQSVKGKAVPLQFWTDPEDSRGLRLSDFKTIGTLRW
jgi:hypothetical protein